MIAGYKIVDFTGVEITPNAQTATNIPGLYNKIKSANSPIVVNNLNIKYYGVLPPFYGMVQTQEGAVRIAFINGLSSVMVLIDDDDDVTVTTYTLAQEET